MEWTARECVDGLFRDIRRAFRDISQKLRMRFVTANFVFLVPPIRNFTTAAFSPFGSRVTKGLEAAVAFTHLERGVSDVDVRTTTSRPYHPRTLQP